MNENYNQVPNNGQPQYDYNNNYNNVAYNDNNGYHEEKSTGKNIFIIVLGIIIIILIILLLLKFCGSGGRLTGIKIGDVPIIYVGEKEEVPVSALGTGKRDETKFNFSLKNENIATLEDETQTGRDVEAVIKGKAPGDTTLTVTAELGNKHVGPEKATVIVCGRLEVGDITDNTITVQRGKKKSLKLDLGTDDRCYAALKFDFEDEGIARVTDDYEIEGLEAGKTTLTVSDGGSNSVEYDVVVNDPNAKIFATGIHLNASSITVCVGKTKTLKATISPSNASDKSVMWSSNKTSVATVSNGRVTGHKQGTAQITVMTQDGSDKTATANVKVVKCSTPTPTPTPTPTDVKVTSITPSPTSVTVEVSKTATVTAGIKPTNATNQTVKCTSSNTAYFTVSASGKNCIITGVKVGSGTLTITANDGSGKKATVPVTVKKCSDCGSPGPSTPTPTCTPSKIDTNCTSCSGSGNNAICTACKSGYHVSNDKKKCDQDSTGTEKKNCWCINPSATTISGCVTALGKKAQRDCSMTCRGGTPKWQDSAPACPYNFYNGTCVCSNGKYGGTCYKVTNYASCSQCTGSCKSYTDEYGQPFAVCTMTKTASGLTSPTTCAAKYGSGWYGTITEQTSSFACTTYSTCTQVCNAKGMAAKSGTCTRAN
jgi:uncharacterized protein YjdB